MNRYLTILALAVLGPVFALAGIIRVPQDQPTIQAGINAAVNGDTVLVAENTYFENIMFKGKAITVASLFIMDGDTNHINNTVINGSQPANPDSGSVVYFISGEDTNSVLRGLTVTGGSGTYVSWFPEWGWEKDGGGIFVAYAGAKIEKNKIIQNHITAAGDTFPIGAGIIAMGDAGHYLVIRNNDISHNSATTTGASNPGGTVTFFAKDTCWFGGNRVSHNECNTIPPAYGYAGGLYISGGMGSHAGYQGPYFIRNNIISNNIVTTPGSGGGGVLIQNANPVLTNNIISGNQAGSWGGGGIFVYHHPYTAGGTRPELVNNTITNNSTTGEGGGICVSGGLQAAVKIMNTILWGNSAPTGPQIYTTFSSMITVRYSDVQVGWPGEGNIDLDPQFVAGDPLFHLTDTSPCVNSGADSLLISGQWYYCPPDDYEGDERPYMGSMADMGADETQVPPPTRIEPQPLAGIPVSYALEQNYPNPFNPSTTIEFALPKAGLVTLTIYNVAGEKVTTLVSENLAAGSYEYRWDARGLASGVYFYRLEAGNFTQTRKMLLIR